MSLASWHVVSTHHPLPLSLWYLFALLDVSFRSFIVMIYIAYSALYSHTLTLPIHLASSHPSSCLTLRHLCCAYPHPLCPISTLR